MTITDADLASAIGSDTATATRLLAVASEVVTRYAPDAPDAIHNEAVIRLAGWLWQSPPGVLPSSVGERDFQTQREHVTGGLRSSGAMSLLRPYKSVGAGVCG